ncbi:MAG: hypothetical protein QXW35_01465 [Candidatus Aenigmatarchaeota archaeon]|nr:hypothetical protein [Candidatus Aenigmarchaeota archaeon]
MRCIRCGSKRLIDFIDGFGRERVFCKDCFLSLEKRSFIRLSFEKRSLEPYLKIVYKTWNMKQ